MPPPPAKSAKITRQKGRLIKGGATKSKREATRIFKEEERKKAIRMDELNHTPGASEVILKQNTTSLLSKAGNRLTTGAHIRVAELDHDPIAFAVKIIKGEVLTENHPFLAYLFEKAAECREARENGKVIDPERFIDELIDKGQEMLTDSWTPPKLRMDSNRDLLKYLYPTLKSVDHSGTVNHNHTHIAVLQAQEVLVFRDKFNDDF